MSLLSILAHIYMGEYSREKRYPQVNAVLVQLEKSNVQTITTALLEEDEVTGNTPLMYTVLFLRPSWIRRVVALVRRTDICERILNARNGNKESVLMLLLEAEQVNAEETGRPMYTGNIRLLMVNGARPDDDTGGKSALQYVKDMDMDIVLCGLGLRKTRSKKNR